jgi:hypothetical protein
VEPFEKLPSLSPRSSSDAGASKTATFTWWRIQVCPTAQWHWGGHISVSQQREIPFCTCTGEETHNKPAHNQRDSHTRSENEKIYTKMGASWLHYSE